MFYLAGRFLIATWAWFGFMSHLPVIFGPLSTFASDFPEFLGAFSCPARCACFGTTVDCASRGLDHFPAGVPFDTQRLDVQGNRLKSVLASDLSGLVNLRILQLHSNKISSVEDDAFRDLKKLQRLRLDKNVLKQLPDRLFVNCPNLYKLELSHNGLKIIGKKFFEGLSQLRYLLLDDNEISCIDEKAFVGMEYLEILTMMNNNITTLWDGTFRETPRLRAVRVAGNKLICDCHLGWLGRWLAAAPHLAPYIRCSSPFRLKDKLISEVKTDEFKCTGLVNKVERGCHSGNICPRACRCGSGIVDCRDTGQFEVPVQIPQDTIELRSEHNDITEVPSNAFTNYKLLKRIDLSKNKIRKISDSAFRALYSLNSLVLYGNKIETISGEVFRGLKKLQLLLLNANQIQCVHKNAFKDLRNLSLLSLYDNQIHSLPDGVFDLLFKIQTMHLGSNPFNCDCELSWLARYLTKNPVETSGAKCHLPERLAKKPLGRVKPELLKCSKKHKSSHTETCSGVKNCPKECDCADGNVNCSHKKLTYPPRGVPEHVVHLDFSHNHLTTLETSMGLQDLLEFPKLSSLDLSHNQLVSLSSKFFNGAAKLASLDVSHNKLISIEENLMQKLAHLFKIDLSKNELSCVSNEIIEYNPNVKTIDVSGNPLHCGCEIKWLKMWLKNHPSNVAPKCQSPENLKSISLDKVSDDLFDKCTEEESAGCSRSTACPEPCSCNKGIVRCTRSHLTQIPDGLPSDTTELYLDVNDISEINSTRIGYLKALKKLDFSNNRISTLANDTFKQLDNLATLFISYNKLGCIERNSLRGLKSLRILSLHGNDISYLPEGTFDDLNGLSHIALGANPLYCDCTLAWLAKWVKNDYVEPGIAKCAEPRSMRDKLVLSTPPALFVCKGKVPDNVLAKCDVCYTHPCEHGGKCQSESNGKYRCHCTSGFYGNQCQYKIDACYGDPCLNGGTCKVFETGRFECHCQRGFTGERCEINVNDCERHKCANGALCVDGDDSYDCQCKTGFVGRYCEKKIEFCSKEFNPCKNNARCTDLKTEYSCECAEGWSGLNCTQNIDDCERNLCQNGGQCIDGIGKYECKCVGEWTGTYCELGPTALQQTEPCVHHDCTHGVCVVPHGKSEYICKCLSGYSGKYCEHQTTVSFVDAKSFVQIIAPTMKKPVNLTMVFTTSQNNGVLLYLGENREHLAVELFQKRIRISFDCGNKPTSVMFSYEVVSDKKEHSMELLIDSHNISLRIDKGQHRQMTNRGKSPRLDVKSSLFIGGVPSDIGTYAVKHWHLRNLTSFIGCLNVLTINGKPQDIAKSEKQNKIVPGCDGVQLKDQGRLPELFKIVTKVTPALKYSQKLNEIKDPCDRHKCANGKCRARSGGRGYKCRCARGFGGKYCTKEPTCTKELEKAFVYDYGCRSRKPVKQYKCTGTCGKQCCEPKRYRTKKVSMICNDGTKFVKKVDIVRKCSCKRRCSRN